MEFKRLYNKKAEDAPNATTGWLIALLVFVLVIAAFALNWF